VGIIRQSIGTGTEMLLKLADRSRCAHHEIATEDADDDRRGFRVPPV